MRRLPLALLLATAAVAVAPALPAGAAPGALTQLADPFGCHVFVPVAAGSPCSGAQGIEHVTDIAVVPSGGGVFPAGGNVYTVTGSPTDSVAAFQRDAASGNLSQLGGQLACVANTGSPDPSGDADCAKGRGLRGASAVDVSPDGKSVYVVGDGVAAFNRPSGFGGALAQLSGRNGCITLGGILDGVTHRCRSGRALTATLDAAVSPDGKHVYVTSFGASGKAKVPPAGLGSGVAILRRTTSGAELGRLTYLGCVATQQASFSGCEKVKGLRRPQSATVSPDGKHVYVASSASDAVAVFNRNASTGLLTQLDGSSGCVSNDTGSGPKAAGCASGKALDFAEHVVVSPDGESVYVSSRNATGGGASGGTAIFSRDPGTGALGQVGCVNDTSGFGCTNAQSYTPLELAVSPDGLNVYAASGTPCCGNLNVFRRNSATGLLTSLAAPEGCLTEVPLAFPDCGTVHNLPRARSVAVSPDGRNVYVGTFGGPGRGLLSFARSPAIECPNQTVQNQGGSGADFPLLCSNALGEPLTYSIVSQPAGGTVTIEQKTFPETSIAHYLPNSSFVGPDPFTYKATGPSGESNVATITVNNVAG